MSKFLYLCAALLGMLMHAVGLVLQKKGMDHLDFKAVRRFEFNRDFVIWSVGILLAYVVSVLPTGIASNGLSPQIVSSISGLGIVVVILLSHFFLKEQVFLSDIVFSAIIVLGILEISVIKDVTPSDHMNVTALCLMIAAPFLLLLPLFWKKIGDKWKTFLFAALSGLASGLCYVLLNIAVKGADGVFAALFSAPYIYLYTAVGFVSTISMQAAYRFGQIIHIAPLQISLSIVYPLVCSYFVFGKALLPGQDLLILMIALCCALIQKKH